MKVKKNTRKITFAILGMLVLLASCREKDKGAAKTDVVMPDAKEPVNDVVQETQSDEKSEPDFGDWFMAQTDSAPVKSVIATSELVEAQFEGRYLYPPINILDGDFDSTWCEADKNGSGIGESITVEFAEPVSFDEIQIVFLISAAHGAGGIDPQYFSEPQQSFALPGIDMADFQIVPSAGDREYVRNMRKRLAGEFLLAKSVSVHVKEDGHFHDIIGVILDICRKVIMSSLNLMSVNCYTIYRKKRNSPYTPWRNNNEKDCVQ